MKVLFVSSGNIKKFGISPIVKNQGESLRKEGIDLTYFSIVGKGIFNYFLNILKIKNFLKKNDIDLIHAHYSITAIIATMAAGGIPIVVSLMGSDANHKGPVKILMKFFRRYCWDALIVKSKNMQERLGLAQVEIIPNGVDFELFRLIDKFVARKHLSLDAQKKFIVFIADPLRIEKNYPLAYDVIELLKGEMDVELLIVFGENGVDQNQIPYYLCAADALILTSLSEGSPNVVKEAMACNCPVVSTKVGDVEEIISETRGCYITSYDPHDIAAKLKLAIEVGRTDGRSKITHLSSPAIASRIIALYSSVIRKKEYMH